MNLISINKSNDIHRNDMELYTASLLIRTAALVTGNCVFVHRRRESIQRVLTMVYCTLRDQVFELSSSSNVFSKIQRFVYWICFPWKDVASIIGPVTEASSFQGTQQSTGQLRLA
jgi:hypothetical protein